MEASARVLQIAEVTCPVCSGAQSSLAVQSPQDAEYFVRRTATCAYLRCTQCGSLYQTPFPSAAETDSFYGADYQNYAVSKVPLLSRLIEWQNEGAAKAFISTYGAEASVLDYGCGNAGFLKSLKSQGMQNLCGYEVSLRDKMTTDGITLFNNLSALIASDMKFDVIRMNHVIEHLAEPDETMETLRSLLSDKGVIAGQTPNAAHYTARLFGRYWGPLHFPYHTVLFSPDGLEKAATRWNLKASSTQTCLMPTGWAMSFENIFKTITRSETRGRSAVYTLFMAASAPFVIADRLMGKTAIFDFVLSQETTALQA